MTAEQQGVGNLPTSPSSDCILLFSGGRDSSLAVPRLLENGLYPMLITVTSGHLDGIEKVYKRLEELESILPVGTRWRRVRLINSSSLLPSIQSDTCLPCQRGYAAAGCLIAKELGITNIAFGYAAYQSAFPEQSNTAINLLSNMLTNNGYTLHLPVYEISSVEEVKAELKNYGLNEEAMEQKCLKQVYNIQLDSNILEKETANWVKGIEILLHQSRQIGMHTIEEWLLESSGWRINAQVV